LGQTLDTDVQDLDESQLATRLSHVPSPLPFLGYWCVCRSPLSSPLFSTTTQGRQNCARLYTLLSGVPNPSDIQLPWPFSTIPPALHPDSSFFFPAMLIGPSLDYATYDSLVKGTIYTTPPPGTGTEQAKAAKRRIPYGRKRVAYLHLIIGLAFLGIYAVYGSRGSYTRILGDDWSKWGHLTRFGFIQFAGFVARTKYYAVWSLSEVSRTSAIYPYTIATVHVSTWYG
jgi:hypothetical protein